MRHIELGATLYVPATRRDLLAIANGAVHPDLRSMIFCTEDAVRADQLEDALAKLELVLPLFAQRRAHRYIRVRNPDVLERLLAAPGIERVDGFVLPKVTRPKLRRYFELLAGRDEFALMPTLETAEVFDAREMGALRRMLCEREIHPRILALRIGGNDLMSLLGVRRSCRRTVYETAIGPTIAMLAGTFIPYGLNLTAPVFEGLAHPEVLREEVERDLEHGLFAKTAVHPEQVPLIESAYAVAPDELEMAERVLDAGAPAVFQLHDKMCEKATHARWALLVRARAVTFGVSGARAVLRQPR